MENVFVVFDHRDFLRQCRENKHSPLQAIYANDPIQLKGLELKTLQKPLYVQDTASNLLELHILRSRA